MANFPSSVSTNANLYIAVNGLQTTLAANILATDTTIQLTSTTGFPSTGFVTIDNAEVVSYTGISGANLTGCTRGADGTTALAHNTGVTVGATIVAAHHNLLKDEVIAIETALGAGYAQASANTANAVVQRDGSGNFSAGTITASLTGHASLDVAKTGDTMTGDLTMDNQNGIIFKEPTGAGSASVKVEAPDSGVTSYTIKLPPTVAAAGQVLTDAAGNGVLSWASTGTGTVTSVSGTTNQITSTGGTAPVLALASPLTPPGAITGGDGSASAPEFSFASDTTTGIYSVAAGSIGITAGGSQIARFNSNGIIANTGITINAQDGTVSAPGFTFNNDLTNGLYRIGSNNIGIAANGIKVADIESSHFETIGTTTNDNAPSGFQGEYVESTIGSTNFPATTTFGDLTSISLTAGDWDVTAGVRAGVGTAVGMLEFTIGVSTTSGNSTTGLTLGDNEFDTNAVPTSNGGGSLCVPVYRLSLSTTTTVYLKYESTYSSGNPNARARLSARRVR